MSFSSEKIVLFLPTKVESWVVNNRCIAEVKGFVNLVGPLDSTLSSEKRA